MQLITVRAPRTLTLLNFGAEPQRFHTLAGSEVVASSVPITGDGRLPPYGARVPKLKR